jgi:predicted transcriptional regulator YheO
MDEKEIFRHYTNIAEVLGKMFPSVLEVCVHDLSKPKHSIIAIFNGHITGREIGHPTTDIGFQRLRGEIPDRLINYKNETPSGEPLKSSAISIRNAKGHLLGTISFHLRISLFEQQIKFLESFMETVENEFIPPKENFYFSSPKEEIRSIYQAYLLKHGISTTALSKKEKFNIVGYFYKDGHFNKRGIVSILSDLLKLSRPTIYSFLRKHEKAIQSEK